VVSFDCGTSHQGFVLDDGRAFTWGNNRFGMLGLGTTKEHDVTQPQGALLYGTTEEHDIDQPQEVSFFVQQGLKVVAIGCGGHVSWTGGFTLFLCDDNTLWQSGKLTEMTCSTPQQIDAPEIVSRHILSISCGEDWAAVVASGLGSDMDQAAQAEDQAATKEAADNQAAPGALAEANSMLDELPTMSESEVVGQHVECQNNQEEGMQ